MVTKAAVKAARAALDAKKWEDAIAQAEAILSEDKEHFYGLIFLGLGLEKIDRFEEAVDAFRRAIEAKPKDIQGWKGLLSVYERDVDKYMPEYLTMAREVAERVAEGFKEGNKQHCENIINRAIKLAKKHGTETQNIWALELQLPTVKIPTIPEPEPDTNILYTYLEGRLPLPFKTYSDIATIVEASENRVINNNIGERRTRIGARLTEVTVEVKREVFAISPLLLIYQQIIDWAPDSTMRREAEEKILLRAHDHLLVLPSGSEEKAEKRDLVLNMAQGMVIIKHHFQLAWEIELEWWDGDELRGMKKHVLEEFGETWSESGLGKVINGFLNSNFSPFEGRKGEVPLSDDGSDEEGGISLTRPEDMLLLMNEGLSEAQSSVLAHRIMGEYYLYLEEYENATETLRKAVKLIDAESVKSGLKLQKSKDALYCALATALVQYQFPKNHPEARVLFKAVLDRKPTFIPALTGFGLILQGEEEYQEAIQFFSKVLEQEPSNQIIGTELAWCRALNGDYKQGMDELEYYRRRMNTQDARARELLAKTTYRIGMCLWNLETSKAKRKDRSRGYERFISAIRINPSFAPAYGMLGIYYADYAKDKKRAKKCFRQAFELSTSEIEAAERLARIFADEGDWEMVELVALRAIDAGKTKPTPGSKKKPVSWPHSSLGVVQMNRSDYAASIASFLAALRISPDDYNSWVGLGESYHNSGRYMAAAKAFKHAEEPGEGVPMKTNGERWYTKFMLANVSRELGDYDDAIKGYYEVLDLRPGEFAVSTALLQTFVERAWRSIETGFFGRAASSAAEGLKIASDIMVKNPQAFNLWKSTGDACSVFSWVQGRVDEFPFGLVKKILESGVDLGDYKIFSDIDGVDGSVLNSLKESSDPATKPLLALSAAILAHKRAIFTMTEEKHAGSVAWYNLGWTLYRTSTLVDSIPAPPPSFLANPQLLKASLRAFKRAIELEPSNSLFWHALGVTSAPLNPRVSQHSFVRSLHLNDRSARSWTGLGSLYLSNGDIELAHAAFTRAQSTDPDYAQAWVGEGMVAQLANDKYEALDHFVHAENIAMEGNLAAKKAFSTAAFDHLQTLTSESRAQGSGIGGSISDNSVASLVGPLLATQQIETLDPSDLPSRHLRALFLERVGAYKEAANVLEYVCKVVEEEYEENETPLSLARFAMAKADIPRCYLATGEWSDAVKEAEFALNLIDDDEEDTSDSKAVTTEKGSDGLDHEQRRKVRLSSLLTAGLALYYQHKEQNTATSNGPNVDEESDTLENVSMDDCIAKFRDALTASDNAPDVVCILAGVLWEHGGEQERRVAFTQLFDAADRDPEHVGVRLRLGALATLKCDWKTANKVRDELMALRTGKKKLDPQEIAQVESLLEKMAALEVIDNEEKNGKDDDQPFPDEVQRKLLTEAQRAIKLAPENPDGWNRLARLAGDNPYPAEMALELTKAKVPPGGNLTAEDLARAYAATGKVRDAQRAIVLAPWLDDGYKSLAAAVLHARANWEG